MELGSEALPPQGRQFTEIENVGGAVFAVYFFSRLDRHRLHDPSIPDDIDDMVRSVVDMTGIADDVVEKYRGDIQLLMEQYRAGLNSDSGAESE